MRHIDRLGGLVRKAQHVGSCGLHAKRNSRLLQSSAYLRVFVRVASFPHASERGVVERFALGLKRVHQWHVTIRATRVAVAIFRFTNRTEHWLSGTRRIYAYACANVKKSGKNLFLPVATSQRSTARATAFPPPRHSAAIPRCTLRRCIS